MDKTCFVFSLISIHNVLIRNAYLPLYFLPIAKGKRSCKEAKYTMTESGLPKAGLPSSCRYDVSSVIFCVGAWCRLILPNTCTIRAKTTVTPELLLLSNLGRITMPNLG